MEYTCSGHVKQSSQNRTAYSLRAGHLPSPFHRCIHGVPKVIQTAARKPFKMSLAPPGTYELGLYNLPYTPIVPEEFLIQLSEEEELFLDKEADGYALTAVLNGRQHQLLLKHGARRTEAWKFSREGIMEEIKTELKDRITSWMRYLEEDGMHSSDHRVAAARAVGLEWGAKIICCMARELEVMRKGRTVYQATVDNSLLPWQCMNCEP